MDCRGAGEQMSLGESREQMGVGSGGAAKHFFWGTFLYSWKVRISRLPNVVSGEGESLD